VSLFDRPGPIPGTSLWPFVSHGKVACLFCELTRDRAVVDFATRDLGEMLAHLDEHRAAGHVVPPWLGEHLRESWRQLPWMTKERAR
jgi:hypothetical protein